MNIHTLTVMAILLISNSVAFIPVASAANSAMYYPGSNCQPTYGTQAGDFTSGYKSIKNNSKDSRLVTCPLPTNLGSSWSAVDFNVRSPSSNTKKFACYVVNLDKNGTFHSYGSSSPLSTGKATHATMRTNDKSFTVYQNLYCNVPPQSEINWYRPGFAID